MNCISHKTVFMQCVVPLGEQGLSSVLCVGTVVDMRIEHNMKVALCFRKREPYAITRTT
jgi:hypothetical protein